MSIFSSIRNAIFGHAKAPEPSQSSASTKAAAPSPGTPTPSAPAPSVAPPVASASTATPAGSVDVAAVLDKAVADSGQHLDWKHSIVDMMKALKLDSSLGARKELAGELGYKGDMADSAAMNIWLHKAVMTKLAANGGRVPADLQD